MPSVWWLVLVAAGSGCVVTLCLASISLFLSVLEINKNDFGRWYDRLFNKRKEANKPAPYLGFIKPPDYGDISAPTNPWWQSSNTPTFRYYGSPSEFFDSGVKDDERLRKGIERAFNSLKKPTQKENPVVWFLDHTSSN